MGSPGFPKTVWGSEIGLFESFGVGPDDEDSVELKLVSDVAFKITWARPVYNLIIGTTIGEFNVNSGSNNTSITPTAYSARLVTRYGSNSQIALDINDEILFLQKAQTKLRNYILGGDSDTYTGENLFFLASQFGGLGINKIIFVKEPNPVLYAITQTGLLLSGTYDRKQKVVAWTQLETDGYFMDVESIENDGVDQVWVTVKRTINGISGVHCSETLEFSEGVNHLNPYVDSHLIISNPVDIDSITTSSVNSVNAPGHGLISTDEVILKHIQDPLFAELDPTKTNMSTLNNKVFTVGSATTDTFVLLDEDLTIVDLSNYNEYGSEGQLFKLATTLIGLEHLNGKTVSIRADGAVQAEQIVENGAILLETAAGEAVIGLPIRMSVETLPIEFDLGYGSLIGQRFRWVRPLIYVVNSTSPILELNDEIPTRNSADSMDQAVPLYTGYLEYGSLDWKNTSSITITSDEPLPVYLIGFTGTIEAAAL